MNYRDFLDTIQSDKKIVVLGEGTNRLFVHSKHGPRRIVSLPLHFTEGMAFLGGLIIGDGHMVGHRGGLMKYNIKIEMTDLEIIRMFQKKMLEEFGLEIGARKRNHRPLRKQSFIVSFDNKSICTLFNRVLEIPYGRKSALVKVPTIIANDRKLQKEFIEGLFLADGGVNRKSIIFCSISKDLSDGVMEMLHGMGIKTTTQKFLNKKFGRFFYESYIRGENMEKFKLLFPRTAIKFAGVA